MENHDKHREGSCCMGLQWPDGLNLQARDEPRNYRPITCLNTCYKICTAMMNSVLMTHVSIGKARPENQRALRKGQWPCTHALLLDQACVMDAGYQKKHRLSLAWLDFKKAFDSIPHQHLRFMLESISSPPTLLTMTGRLMKLWSTRLEIKGKRGRTVKSVRMNTKWNISR